MKLNLSFPTRILIAIALVILIPPIYLATQWLAHGTVRFTSSLAGGYVVEVRTEKRHPLPVTLTRPAGRHRLIFGAPGYVEKTESVIFPTLRFHRTVRFTLAKARYSEEDPEAAKKVPLGEKLPYFAIGQFEISFPAPDGTYSITLLPNPNWYPQKRPYQAALRRAKGEALSWIKGQGVDPTTLSIKWVPYDPGG